MPAVDVRTLDRIADLAEAEALFTATWPGLPPATAGLMRALEHAGGYVAGAYLDGVLVGAAAAFLASHPAPGLHSHLAAVAPRLRGHGVGYALKLHQRAWAAEQGLEVVTWTFDPLVRRNAWFNIAKLGAGIGEYLVDFYGRMDDGVNDGDESDRMLAVWPVHDLPAAPTVRSEVISDTVQDVVREVDGRPVVRDVGEADVGEVHVVGVATPADVESLRRSDPDLAHAWRVAVREAVVPRFGTHRVTGFTREGSYLLTPAR